MKGRVWLVGLLVTAAILMVTCSEVKKKKKSVLDYNDADVERIFREWEVCILLNIDPAHVN